LEVLGLYFAALLQFLDALIEQRLQILGSDGTAPRKLTTMAGRIGWLRWSPDGNRCRYTVNNRQNNSRELRETDIDESGSRPLLPGWNSPAAECCGNWTAVGTTFSNPRAKARQTSGLDHS